MELRVPTAEQLKIVYGTDLTHSFLPAELKPLLVLREMWERGEYEPLCLFDGEEIVGEAFLWRGDPGWMLLDYLCVSPRRRNAGLGGRLLRQVLRREPGTVVLGEVEAPESAPDRELAVRRLGFYQREHARMAGYEAEIFGVHYQNLYWADGPVADETLMEQHRRIYRRQFSAESCQRQIRIPRQTCGTQDSLRRDG